jgi:hypothetical protein
MRRGRKDGFFRRDSGMVVWPGPDFFDGFDSKGIEQAEKRSSSHLTRYKRGPAIKIMQ